MVYVFTTGLACVPQLIQFVQPECVMLELCRGRVNILEMDEDNIEEELKALNMGEKQSTSDAVFI